jgi:hypothetical protein
LEAQRRGRAGLASERNEAADILSPPSRPAHFPDRQGRRIETEAAPIRYVADLIGGDTDSDRAIRWLIALIGAALQPAHHRADGATSGGR